MEADKEKHHSVIVLGPHDADGLADTRFKNFIRPGGVQVFNAQSKRSLVGSVVGSDLSVSFVDQELLVAREAVEALEVTLLIDKLHLPFLDALL